MAPQKLRTTVAALATSAGLVVLMSGPASTFGLSAPTGDTVTGAVQDTVQTTEQTAATTVTQVDSTVQATAPTVTAPAPTAPTPSAPAPVQAAAQTVTAAPNQATSRTPAPVRQHTAAAPRPAASPQVRSTRQVASAAGSATRSVQSTVTRHAAARTHAAPSAPASTRSRDAATTDSPAQCDVPLLSLLPGGDQLAALVALVCDAANGLDLPTRIGPAQPTTSPTLAEVIDAITSAPPARTRARSAAPGAHRAAAAESRTPAAVAAQAGRPGAAIAMPVGPGTGVAGATNYVNTFKTPSASIGSAAATHASDATAKHHHTWFSGTSRGTELLMAILFASLSVLGGIVLWRLAVRWVIPHFA